MREILFRGKRIDNGEWIEGFYCQTADESNGGAKVKHVIVVPTFLVQKGFLMYEVDSSTIGQYTGFTDKNGKMIFEGDIISIYVPCDNKEMTGIIKIGKYKSNWDLEKTHIGLHIEWNEKSSIKRVDFGFWIEAYRDELEVIGNIHDNFELFNNSELLEDKP